MTEDFSPGTARELVPGVRRLVAPNPGMMTGPGTNTYLLGVKEIAVIDPGPAIGAHLDAIEEQAGGDIRWILATHTHPDHSPAAKPLAERTGAMQLGRPAPPGKVQDLTFRPDKVLEDGDLLETAEFTLQAVHTPGHASNHVCFRHETYRMLFTGDHIMSGSTVVIDPPDGNMMQYLESLQRLKSLNLDSLAPGHGTVIEEPDEMVDWLIGHRLGREAKVIAALEANPGLELMALTQHVYADVDPGLHGLASRSLLAHLLKLEIEDRAICENDRWSLTSQ